MTPVATTRLRRVALYSAVMVSMAGGAALVNRAQPGSVRAGELPPQVELQSRPGGVGTPVAPPERATTAAALPDTTAAPSSPVVIVGLRQPIEISSAPPASSPASFIGRPPAEAPVTTAPEPPTPHPTEPPTSLPPVAEAPTPEPVIPEAVIPEAPIPEAPVVKPTSEPVPEPDPMPPTPSP